jgi:hypothetical protein
MKSLPAENVIKMAGIFFLQGGVNLSTHYADRINRAYLKYAV